MPARRQVHPAPTPAPHVLTFGAGAMWAVMLIVPAVEYAAALARVERKIRVGWLVSENGRSAVCRTTCHAPDMALYRENLKSRRSGHGF